MNSNKMRLMFFTLALFLGVIPTVFSFEKSKMDSLFSVIENNDKGMGSISIFHDGKEVYSKSYGYSNIENKTNANSDTKYRVGSVSKTFTATIIMKLVEDKKLTLDTKLSKYYPQIINADDITIEDLLRHRSGIFNFTNAPDYLEWHMMPLSKEQLLDKMVSYGNSFKPNEKAEYSNSNYVLLTFIAEDVSHKTFSDLLSEYIIKPCGLKNTSLGSKINKTKNEADSYTKLGEWRLEKETDLSFVLGAGAIISTPTELNIFYNKLFDGKIVDQKSLELMKTIKYGFGIGLFQVPFYDLKGFGHTGGIDGFQANVFYFPEQKVSIALTSNAVDFPLNDIVLGALSIYWDKEYKVPVFEKAVTLKSEDLDKYLGVYSAPNFPIKLTISKEGNILKGQGTGQPAFALECFDVNKFKFDQAKLKIEFYPDENKMILKQGGAEFNLKRE
ncbi:serine hydrolase domain-containing protein [Dysgonomonas sp. HGC4]|uniref:serine hydrolase domain-containing protein n=1 Tax=Dysgonomonas sp. HGC4 TaxID=1658009 RepID=UPI000681BB9D|nr:serine hydrolase domain-containing protein [Dysgonomonas sp. HGC4]MBD8347180.1 beta-lactamase family protein [Dysgonomonas sp. HGC4]